MSRIATSWTGPYSLATVVALLVLGVLFVTLGTYRPALVEPAASIVVIVGLTGVLVQHLRGSGGR